VLGERGTEVVQDGGVGAAMPDRVLLGQRAQQVAGLPHSGDALVEPARAVESERQLQQDSGVRRGLLPGCQARRGQPFDYRTGADVEVEVPLPGQQRLDRVQLSALK
jgi:hypothetical protein